jgi:hypothetical protein
LPSYLTIGAKLEVKLKKAESGSWAKLDIPKVKEMKEEEKGPMTILDMSKAEPMVESLDLDDLDITPQRFKLSEAATTKPKY